MERGSNALRNVGLNVAGIFSGIGGFELAFHTMGAPSILVCESDPAAQRILEAHFPHSVLIPDIRDLKRLPPSVNVVCAGFPCQDLSMAGGKNGIDGARSSIVRRLFDLLSASPVEWVILENVYFMLHLRGGHAMSVIAEALEKLGYRWAYRTIDTLSFLPQRRRRVFIVASLSNDPRRVLFDSESTAVEERAKPITLDRPVGFYWTEGRSGVGLASDSIPPLKGGSGLGIPSPPAILLPDGRLGTPSLRDCEKLQGFFQGWTDPGHSANGRADQRWRLVGNAVSVPVVKWIASRISKTSWPAVPGGTQPLEFNQNWPAAAFNVDGRRFMHRVNERIPGASLGLLDLVQDELKPLSERAIRGFLSRAREGRLSFPEGFLKRIEACLP